MTELLGDLAAFVASHPGELARRTVEHLWISGAATVIALALALPVGLTLGHLGKGGAVAVNAANVGRALPSLGIIALAMPFLGLGEAPAILALALLGIPPALTNSYVAVRQVDRDVVEAARGMGMGGLEVLRTVELPLAAPVVISGVRTAAVQVVATATLAAVIAGGGYGRFIIDGFATGDNAQVLTGAIAVALLTVLVELALEALERAVTPRGLARGAGQALPGAPPPGQDARLAA